MGPIIITIKQCGAIFLSISDLKLDDITVASYYFESGGGG